MIGPVDMEISIKTNLDKLNLPCPDSGIHSLTSKRRYKNGATAG